MGRQFYEARWGWLKTVTTENPKPFSDADFDRLRAHLTALQFWPGGTSLPIEPWHFHPREFMKQFRQCGWLSTDELAQCLPRHRPTVMPWLEARRRSESFGKIVNTMGQKYLGASRIRQAHMLAQIFIESDLLNTLSEYSKGRTYPYGPFFGRGLMQLTWAKNYSAYGAYRQFGRHVGAYQDVRINDHSEHVWEAGGAMKSWAPRFDPAVIENDAFSAGDSGGFYWVSKTFRANANITRVCDLGTEARLVGYVSWLINGGGNGYRERQLFFAFLTNHLLDEVRISGSRAWRYPSLNANLTATYPPGTPANNEVIQVSYEEQIP